MQKKVLAMVLFLCMIAGTLIPTAYAVGGDTWTEHVTKMPSGYVEDTNGKVTISSAEGLAWFAKQVNEEANTFAGKTITLAQSIDLSSYEWVPIGTQDHPFCGTFDGGGNTISGMKLNSAVTGEHYAGLFGFVRTGALRNITISEITVQIHADNPSSLWAFGILAGCVLSTEVDHIKVINAQEDVDVQSAAFALIGGIVGLADFITGSSSSLPPSTFSDCVVENLAVTYQGKATYHISTGGILGGQGKIAAKGSSIGIGSPGVFSGLSTEIRNSTVKNFSVIRTTADSSNYEMMGGVVGYAHSAGSITNCCTTGLDFTISATVPEPAAGGAWSATAIYGVYGGGIAGSIDGGMTVTSCTTEGEISANVAGGFEVPLKSGGKYVRGGFFGGITGLIGSMPEPDGWGGSRILAQVLQFKIVMQILPLTVVNRKPCAMPAHYMLPGKREAPL